MIKIADIKELKLNITWKLLYRGLLEKQISINEIIEYAKEQLEKGDDRIEICELAGSSDYDLEDVMDTLYELAKEEKNPDDLEDRKLRAARVNKFLKDKNTNCIDGLMGLTELWLELGCTADSPHIIQGKDNSISPVEYYTDANYNYLYEKNGSKVISAYDENAVRLSESDKREMLEAARQYNEELLGNIELLDPFSSIKKEVDERYQSLLNVNGSGMIGYIRIPKINAELPIYHGTEEKVLQSGVAILRGRLDR